jgi:REP element-mobilizing transposase RayT
MPTRKFNSLCDAPLAYHITFATYGTRLHGDERGTVDRVHNKRGTPLLTPEPERVAWEESLLRFPPTVLTNEQRLFAQIAIPEVCTRGGWKYQIAAVQPDHVHVLLSTVSDARIVRRVLKRWLSQAMSERWPDAGERPWWGEGGSIRWILNEDYFETAWAYIHRQRAVAEDGQGNETSEPGWGQPGSGN